MVRRSALALAAGVTALLSGCSPGDRTAPAGWAGSVDTLASGRIVVRSPDAPLWEEPPVLRERVRIGTLEGQGPDLFGQITGLELGPGGEVYVLDGQASEIRVFGADGTFVRRMGREGQGPGELESPAGIALDSEGRLWVMNWGNARYTSFDPATGEVLGEPRRLAGFTIFPWPGRFEDGNRLLDVGLDREGKPAALLLDTAFVPRDTVRLPERREEDQVAFTRDGMMIATMFEPFAPQPAWAPWPGGGIVLGEGSAYRVHRIGVRRDTSMTIELDRTPVRVTDRERDSALAVFDERAANLTEMGGEPDRRPEARATKPFHGVLFVDDQDRTWVSAVLPAGRPPAWDVFGADGRFLGQVSVPDAMAFVHPVVRRSRMVMATQVNGFPEVVVYELVNEAAGRR